MPRHPILVAFTLLTASAAVDAVPYTLPVSSDRPLSKISRDGVTVCATWLDNGACDVPAGTYRLHRYNRAWSDVSSTVTIGTNSPTPVGPTYTRVSETCEYSTLDDIQDWLGPPTITGSYTFQLPCRVSCPAGMVVAAEGSARLIDQSGIFDVHGFDVTGHGQSNATVWALNPPSVSTFERAAGIFDPADAFPLSFEMTATALCVN